MFKFPPFLTEQWASAYFQILFSSLVFAIGIPFLGLQLVMQEDVRHVVTFRQWKLLLWLLLVLLLFMSAVSFIWYLHPAQSQARERRAASRRSAEAAPGDQNPAIQANAAQQPSPPPGTEGEDATEGESEELEALTAGLIVTIVPVATLIFGYWLPTNYTRKKVIRQFKSDLISGFNKTGALKKETLQKLVYLGEHGNAGIEKNLVLNAFLAIAEHVQKSTDKYQYKGRELAELVRSLRIVVEEGEKRGNDENYKRTAELLRSIWSRVTGDFSNQDATLAASSLKQLGLTAVREKSEETAIIYVMHAAECDDSVVFELGLAALNAKRYRVATIALAKLETLALREQARKLEATEEVTETVSNLLGLLVQYNSHGTSAGRRAEQFLSKAGHLFSPSMQECVASAITYHYRAGSFDTADKLIKLSEKLEADRVPRQ